MIVDPGRGQVDHGHARLGPTLEVAGVLQRLGDDARRQAELAAVGDLQSRFVVLDADGRGDRAEDLFSVDAHGRISVGDQGRLDVPAGRLPRQALAARDDLPSLEGGEFHIAIGGLALILADGRADLGVRIEGVADPQGSDLLRQSGDEAVMDAVLHDQAARRRAALAGGEEAAVQGDGHGALQIGVVQHD
ncbi:hypothetical protein D3C85_442490 [compost metagenome]